MASPAVPIFLSRLDASLVDPATVTYLQDLVNFLHRRCFHIACDGQIAAMEDPTFDIFRLRPEPSLLAGVPDQVAAAIATLEELLQQGSPVLAAYTRAAARIRRAEQQQQEAFNAAMSELHDAECAVADYLDAYDAARAHLAWNRHAIRCSAARVMAVTSSVLIGDEASVAAMMAALVQNLMFYQYREQAMLIGVSRMAPYYYAALRRHQIALARVGAVYSTMDGAGDEERVIRDGARHFNESVAVLCEYMA